MLAASRPFPDRRPHSGASTGLLCSPMPGIFAMRLEVVVDTRMATSRLDAVFELPI